MKLLHIVVDIYYLSASSVTELLVGGGVEALLELWAPFAPCCPKFVGCTCPCW